MAIGKAIGKPPRLPRLMGLFCAVLALAALTLAPAWAPAWALEVSPANPQPSEAQLEPGLAVKYVYWDIRFLREARDVLEVKDGEVGSPLPNLSFYSEVGEPALTSHRSTLLAAEITGYMKFPQAGRYELEFASNDGLQVSLGADEIEIYEHDGRHVCGTLGAVTVEVPESGWYPIHMVYFQRHHSSCLWLSWRTPADSAIDQEAVAPEFFGHTPR